MAIMKADERLLAVRIPMGVADPESKKDRGGGGHVQLKAGDPFGYVDRWNN